MPDHPNSVTGPSAEAEDVVELVSGKTESEHLFERYLDSRGLRWAYEAHAGRKQPDYLIRLGPETCICEVKEFDDPDPKPTGGFSACPPIREKINRAARQFREYKHRPCGLVLFNSRSIYRSLDPTTVLSAALGQDFQEEPGTGGTIRPEPSSFRFFGSAKLTKGQNTTISAIIVLAHYELNDLLIEVWRRLYAKQEREGKVAPTDYFDLQTELGQDRPQALRYVGTIRVIAFHNPHARIPFPTNVFTGSFDQQWGLVDGCYRPIWLGSELGRLYNEGVPFVYL